ncbi:MAG: primosomal protein N' [Actinobacteria bacterium]|nr:primosomal protein N' [Actinomycetota bacterium]
MPEIVSVVPLVAAWRLDRTFDYLVPEGLAGLAAGSLVRVPLGGRNVRGVVVHGPERPPEAVGERELAAVLGLVVDEVLVPEPLERLLEWVAIRYAAPRGAVFRRMAPPRVRVARREVEPLTGGADGGPLAHYLGGPELAAAVQSGAAGVWALRPLPGHDRAALISDLVAAAARSRGGSALVLVPEVRYGSAVLDGLTARWPATARVDSGVSDGERARSWLALARGHGLGAGGRAAVLAPMPDLRVVVVDEAHHRTYKEDRSPRYDARRVAVERARIQGAVCVLVGSTPSLELGAQMISGAARVVEPTRAAIKAARPIIELVPAPGERALSHELHRRMNDALRAGGRVALLVPRRGFARTMWCAACRRSLRCSRCEAGVSFDRAGAKVRCPRCGWTAGTPRACPSCGAENFRYLGAGSERLAEQVALSFPRASVARMDPDVLAGTRDEEAGGLAPADIYVTTWIGTKAALRPEVGLVGVLDADALIRRPGFRAAETAYQALSEMAEWAGPAASGGRLVIQTSEPSHHSLQALVRADYRFFLDRELPARAELAYPPYSELIRVTASGPRRDELVASVIAACAGIEARVLGPITGPKGAGRAGLSGSLELLVKCPDAREVAGVLRDILGRVPAGNRLVVDVDPH